MRAVPGLSVAALLGADGLTLATVGEGAELLAAELSGLSSALNRLDRRLGVGEVSRLAFTTANLEVITLSRGGYTLAAALMRGTDTQAAQQLMARLMEDALDQLPPQFSDDQDAQGAAV
ncbi:roadblock/LC7 domain-containing protein [Deinococcus radiophilus]|uniref:roadblock/LC7 domain-containing protein n=1 Tax=Deinococcus radiophilus TaxID=32062 RepID=UPI00360E906C